MSSRCSILPNLILQLHHFVYLGNIRRTWYSEISPRIPFNPLPFFLSQVHRLHALSPFLFLLLLLFVFFFALSLSYQSTMAFHARSAISFLVKVLVHEIERDRKRQWLVVVIFEQTGSIRGSHCSRGPSLAVILGVSRSNKSQVELRGRLPIRLWFIPTGYGMAWINDPLRALRHGRSFALLKYRCIDLLHLCYEFYLLLEFVIKNFAILFLNTILF